MTGRRSYRNTLALLRDVANRMDFERLPLIVTHGFDFYEKVVRRVFGPAALYGQVLKTRRNDRIVKVERRELMGARWRFEEALADSEDLDAEHLVHRAAQPHYSSRLSLLTPSVAMPCSLGGKLEEHLELVRCHYNFVRPHRALNFGRETRTPAMQAGLAKRRLTFRQVFERPPTSLLVSIGAITCAAPNRVPTAPIVDELLAA